MVSTERDRKFRNCRDAIEGHLAITSSRSGAGVRKSACDDLNAAAVNRHSNPKPKSRKEERNEERSRTRRGRSRSITRRELPPRSYSRPKSIEKQKNHERENRKRTPSRRRGRSRSRGPRNNDLETCTRSASQKFNDSKLECSTHASKGDAKGVGSELGSRAKRCGRRKSLQRARGQGRSKAWLHFFGSESDPSPKSGSCDGGVPEFIHAGEMKPYETNELPHHHQDCAIEEESQNRGSRMSPRIEKVPFDRKVRSRSIREDADKLKTEDDMAYVEIMNTAEVLERKLEALRRASTNHDGAAGVDDLVSAISKLRSHAALLRRKKQGVCDQETSPSVGTETFQSNDNDKHCLDRIGGLLFGKCV